MKIKVSQATSLQLDWLVGTIEKVEGLTYSERTNKLYSYDKRKLMARHSPTTSWAQGGPILEREGMTVGRQIHTTEWSAETFDGTGMDVTHLRFGPTPLVAAMRCFISSRLGDEVEIPEELAC